MSRFALAAMLVLLSFNVTCALELDESAEADAGSGVWRRRRRTARDRAQHEPNAKSGQITKRRNALAAEKRKALSARGRIGYPKGVRGEQSRQLAS